MLRYAISPGALLSAEGADADQLVARAGELATDGVDYLLVREKRLGKDELTPLVRRLARVIRGSATRLIVPGNAQLSLAAGAHGVHLSSSAGELRVGAVRKVFTDAWISVSCHELEEVARARADGADAVLFAPVFEKVVDWVEVGAGVGIERLREACCVAGGMPLFALGGVHWGNAASCVEAGAAGVAGIRMFFP